MKRIVLIIVVIALLPAGAAQAGGVKEILLGAGFGTAFGVLVSGTALAFPERPDEVTAKYLLIGGGVGLVGGVVFGAFMPAETTQPRAVFNLDMPGGAFRVAPQALIPDLSLTKTVSEFTLHAGILKVEF